MIRRMVLIATLSAASLVLWNAFCLATCNDDCQDIQFYLSKSKNYCWGYADVTCEPSKVQFVKVSAGNPNENCIKTGGKVKFFVEPAASASGCCDDQCTNVTTHPTEALSSPGAQYEDPEDPFGEKNGWNQNDTYDRDQYNCYASGS